LRKKKFPAAAQGRKKKSCVVSSEEKNIMHGLCGKKKIPANHRHFSMDWLVGANPCL